MKSFGSKPWILPQPVLVIGTYDKEGKPNAMNAAFEVRLGTLLLLEPPLFGIFDLFPILNNSIQ